MPLFFKEKIETKLYEIFKSEVMAKNGQNVKAHQSLKQSIKEFSNDITLKELYYKIKELLNDQELRNNMANNALKVIESNKGSSDIQFNHIYNLLNHEISYRNN